MAATPIDGKAVAERRREALGERVASLRERGTHPCLAAITVVDDPSWGVYTKRQAAACDQSGIIYRPERLPDGSTQEDLIERVELLNADAAVHGIIIQAPLPEGFDLFAAQGLISPAKDVEGVNPANLGLVLAGREGIAPCTARSAFALAEHAMGDLRGVEAVVLGASVIVGKPVAQLLLAAGATVRVCHIDTVDVAAHTREADLLVIAVGKAGLVTRDMVKPGATVIDVGINRVSDGNGGHRIAGDADPDVWDVAGKVTPVPGGVGALTTTILLEHTVQAAAALQAQVPAFAGGALTRILGGSGIDLPPDLAERIAGLLSRHLVTGAAALPQRSALERRLARGVLVLDGGMTSELVARGVDPTFPAQANLDAPDLVQAVHEDFIAAGAEAITTNTFHLNRYACERDQCERLARSAVRLARHAGRGRVLVLGSLGPLGRLVGAEISAEEAEEAYAEIALAMADAGVDGIICETFPSTADASAALRGVRRVTGLPVMVCRSLGRYDRAELAEYAAAMEDGGAVAIGFNCVGGPSALLPAVTTLAALTSLPVVAQPNAGYPKREAGRLSYQLKPEWLARMAERAIAAGVRVVGGCCGIAPVHIAALAERCAGTRPGVPQPLAEDDTDDPPPAEPNPLLCAMNEGAFPIIALISGRCSNAAVGRAAEQLATAGVAGVGLDPGWPGSGEPSELPARLRHLQDLGGREGVLALEAGALDLRAAQTLLHGAHLLGIRSVLIDSGIFAGGREGQRGGGTLQLLGLIRALNQGRDVRGSRIDDPTAFVAGVRLPVEGIDRAVAYHQAGAAFATIQPVYEPRRFRDAMAAYRADMPLLAEILVLSDAETAEALDNEVPALSVPERLHRRLVEDPQEDVRGVLRFLHGWRDRLAGACLLLPDERTAAASSVLRGIAAGTTQ